MECIVYCEYSVFLFFIFSFIFFIVEQMVDIFVGKEEGIIYLCYNNFSVDEFVYKMCSLEGVEVGFVIVFGMLVVFSVLMVLVCSGDYILVIWVVFGFIY